MALIPIKQYQGKTKGHRNASAKEQMRYGKTSYAKNTQRYNDPNEKAYIVIKVTWEQYHRDSKSWSIAIFNGKEAIYSWKFMRLKDAIAYIPKYMKNKGATPNNKNDIEYYFVDNDDWFKDGKQIYANDPRWFNNGQIFVSQWVLKGKNFYRITFKQIKKMEFTDDDYHNPKQSPWSHTAMVGKLVPNYPKERFVRTYLSDEEPDTTTQQQNDYRRKKRSIQRLYDEEKRHVMNMTPQEYREFQHDLHHMSDAEWTEKYGVDHSYYND